MGKLEESKDSFLIKTIDTFINKTTDCKRDIKILTRRGERTPQAILVKLLPGDVCAYCLAMKEDGSEELLEGLSRDIEKTSKRLLEVENNTHDVMFLVEQLRNRISFEEGHFVEKRTLIKCVQREISKTKETGGTLKALMGMEIDFNRMQG